MSNARLFTALAFLATALTVAAFVSFRAKAECPRGEIADRYIAEAKRENQAQFDESLAALEELKRDGASPEEMLASRQLQEALVAAGAAAKIDERSLAMITIIACRIHEGQPNTLLPGMTNGAVLKLSDGRLILALIMLTAAFIILRARKR